jgi:hypothetical protein
MFDYLTKHFLVLSTITIAVGSAISMLVLSAYLSVFDWTLIWMIEYSDLTKLFLIGTALISSIITTLIWQAMDAYTWIVKKAPGRKKVLTVIVIMFLLLNGYSIYRDIRTDDVRLMYHAFRTVSSLLFVWLVVRSFADYQSWILRHWTTILNDLAFLAFCLGIFGATFGYYVRDVSENTREVSTANEIFTDAKIIMILSHHVAFLSRQQVMVIPSTEILRIVAKPASP